MDFKFSDSHSIFLVGNTDSGAGLKAVEKGETERGAKGRAE